MIDWTLTHADSVSAVVWVRSDEAQTVSIELPHGIFSTEVDPDVEHGTGAITVTGLNGDATGTINGEPITVRVSPADPVIAIVSCAYGTEDAWARYLLQQGVNVTVFEGDMPYADDSSITFGGITTEKTAYNLANNTAEQYAKHYLQFRRLPGVRALLHSSLLYCTYDDHEVVNNWDWTLARANTYTTLATDAATLRAVYDRAMQGWTWYNARGNQKPGGLDADPETQYSTCRHGPVEIFMLDCLSHRDDVEAVDDANKYMLGPLQEARLIADVTASTAPYKVIASSKQLFSNANANADSWAARGINTGYYTQLDRILDALYGVDGVVWVCGDDHSPTVVNHPTGCLMVSGSPAGTANQETGQGSGYETGVVFKGFGYAGESPPKRNYHTTNILRLLPSGELSIELHDITRRTKWWELRMRVDGSTYYPATNSG